MAFHPHNMPAQVELVRARRGINGGWALSAQSPDGARGIIDPEAFYSDANAAVIGFAEMIGAPILDRLRPDAVIERHQ